MPANPIPPIGFGTWPLKGEVARDSVMMALDVGFRHIDTAQAYDNEAEVGAAVRGSGLPRGDVFIVTKIHFDNLAPAKFLPSLKRSLDALKFDHVDLLLIHWPPRDDSLFDPALDALAESRALGLARHIGVSNFTPKLLRRAAARAGIIANQVEYHPLIDQAKLKAAADGLGVKLEAYAVLGRGKVFGHEPVMAAARAHGVSEAEVIVRWVMQTGAIPLVQTTKRQNAESNFRAQSLRLSDADMASISALSRANQRFINVAAWAPDWTDGAA